jgi:DNA replication protein DnaC
MNENKLISTLKTLKLCGMAQTVEEVNQQASPVYLQSISLLETLMATEIVEGNVRSIKYQMKTAKFPAHRDLAGFDFAQSQVEEVMIQALSRGEFMEDAQNTVLVGGPGTGKTPERMFDYRSFENIFLVGKCQYKLAGYCMLGER